MANQGGFRGLLKRWLGGAAAPEVEPGGLRGMLRRWMGGVAAPGVEFVPEAFYYRFEYKVQMYKEAKGQVPLVAEFSIEVVMDR